MSEMQIQDASGFWRVYFRHESASDRRMSNSRHSGPRPVAAP